MQTNFIAERTLEMRNNFMGFDGWNQRESHSNVKFNGSVSCLSGQIRTRPLLPFANSSWFSNRMELKNRVLFAQNRSRHVKTPESRVFCPSWNIQCLTSVYDVIYTSKIIKIFENSKNVIYTSKNFRPPSAAWLGNFNTFYCIKNYWKWVSYIQGAAGAILGG